MRTLRECCLQGTGSEPSPWGVSRPGVEVVSYYYIYQPFKKSVCQQGSYPVTCTPTGHPN